MRKSLLTMITAIALLVFSTGPAVASTGAFDLYAAGNSASYPSSCTASASYTGAQVCWDDYGERFWVKDTKADGRRAGAFFELRDPTRVGVCYNTLGNGTTAKCNFEFAEGRVIYISAGTCDGSATGFGAGCDLFSNWTHSAMKKTHA